MLVITRKRCDVFEDSSQLQKKSKQTLVSSKRKLEQYDISSHNNVHNNVHTRIKHTVIEYDRRSILKRKTNISGNDSNSKKITVSEPNDAEHTYEWNSVYNTNPYDPMKLVFL